MSGHTPDCDVTKGMSSYCSCEWGSFPMTSVPGTVIRLRRPAKGSAEFVAALKTCIERIEAGEVTSAVLGYCDRHGSDGKPSYLTWSTGLWDEQVVESAILHKRALEGLSP